MAPLRASTTKSEWLPDDPTAFVPSMPWKLPFITTWDDSRNQNHPTDSAEEAQKCGGTSLNRLLEMTFADRHFDHYPLDQGPFPTRDELVNLVLDRPEIVSLSSHSIRLFPPIIGNRLPLYVAFLREPIQRFISHLTYCKKQYHTFPEGLKQHWSANCMDLS